MKTTIRAIGAFGLFAALAYSVLTLTSSPVYASSCNCAQDQVEAQGYCHAVWNLNSQLSEFDCPSPDSTHFQFVCAADPNQVLHTFPCS